MASSGVVTAASVKPKTVCERVQGTGAVAARGPALLVHEERGGGGGRCGAP